MSNLRNIEDYTYHIEVRNNIAVLVEDEQRPIHVCQNLGEKIYFAFYDIQWEEYSDNVIKALFVWNGKHKIVGLERISSVEYGCNIPAIDGATAFYVGAFVGENPEETPYYTTTRVEIPCKLSIRDYAKLP